MPSKTNTKPHDAHTPGDDAGLLETLLEATSNAIVTLDTGLRVTRFNRAAELLTGWAAEEALGQTAATVLPLLDAKTLRPAPIPEGATTQAEIRQDKESRLLLTGRDGLERLILVTCHPLREKRGQPTGLLVLLRDFTDTLATEKAVSESETRLRRVIEGSRLGYWDWDLENNSVVFSGRWATMLGYQKDEIPPDFQTWERLVHPEDKPRVLASLAALLEGRTGTYEEEHRLLTKTGEWRWILTSGNIVARHPDGRPRQVAGTHTDIHGKKLAEEAEHRRAGETIRFQKALLALRDHEGQDIHDFLRMATEETSEALGVERAGVWLFDDDAEAIVCQDLYIKSENRHASGTSLLRGQFPAYFRSISTRRAVLADHAPTHPDTREFAETYFNPLGITSMLDVPIRLGSQTLGVLCCEHVGPPRRWTPEEEKFAVSLAGSVLLALENVKRREAETAMRGLNENLEKLVAARTRELGESERRFHDLFEFAPDATVMASARGRITLVNQATERLFGHRRKDLLGKPVETLVPNLLRAAKEARQAPDCVLALSLEASRSLLQGVKRDGTHFPVDASLSPVNSVRGAMVISLRDVTERETSQRLLLRTQRLESIGTLAGGVAHDLNNALSPILLASELLRERYPEEPKLIDIIEASARRGSDMVRQLLTFARGVDGARLHVRTSELFAEAGKMVTGTFPKNIRLLAGCPEGLPDILGDATQLHQVLLNLCVNARDAMPDGGILRLEAEVAALSAAQVAESSEARPGRFVIWSVSDTGTGIPPEVLERIFEPFFSTKEPDKGTGLGLSTALGIIRSHGGFIRVSSKPGQGSTFRVHLPAALGSTGGRGSEPASPPRFSGLGRLILVVDDDKLVRDMAATILEALGFNTLTATDGADALLKSAEHGPSIRAVLTDLNMPRMDGMELVRALRQRLPGTGIIVSSGRLEDRQAEELKRPGGVTVLHKPFRQKELIEALKAALAAGP